MKNFQLRLISAAFLLIFIAILSLVELLYLRGILLIICVVAFIELNCYFTKEKKLCFLVNNIYIFCGMYSFYALGEEFGKNVLALIVFISFGTDTFAYISGKLLKGPKLCPSLSPSKTISGLVGGVIGSYMLSSYLYSNVFKIPNLDLSQIALFMLVIGAVLGDLISSKIKRVIAIKDFSSIIPGHGGVLDRIDSIIFVSILLRFFTIL